MVIQKLVTILPMMLSVVCLSFELCFCFTSFVFGDSLVDSGNNDYLLTLSRADSPPYGIDFEPSGGRPTGRFTNGRTIADIIGQALGEESFPPPFLAPNSQEHATSRGINYASGAAGILDETGSLFIERVPLKKQVDYFEHTRNYMASMMGERGTNDLLERAVFSLTVGSNDVINYILPSVPYVTAQKLPPTMYQSFMISNLTLQLKVTFLGAQIMPVHSFTCLCKEDVIVPFPCAKRLREMGARKFVVAGIGPVGCIPFVRALNLFLPDRSCVVQVNQFIQGYNKKLKELVDELNRGGSREAMFVYANSYDIIMEIMLNYRRNGFDNADAPCCGGFFPPFNCNNVTSLMCGDRSKYVFWDAYHPTEAANEVVAQELLDGDQTRSYPINIRQLHNHHFPS